MQLPRIDVAPKFYLVTSSLSGVQSGVQFAVQLGPPSLAIGVILDVFSLHASLERGAYVKGRPVNLCNRSYRTEYLRRKYSCILDNRYAIRGG